jgi:hypothetical protein
MKSELLRRAGIFVEAETYQGALMLLGDEIEQNRDDW